MALASIMGIRVIVLIVKPNKTIPICNGIVETFFDISWEIFLYKSE